MATLTNTQISVTYVGLLKTSANTVLTSTAQQITDGDGNNSIMFLSTAGVGIGGSPASGKELDVTGNVQITGDLIVDNITIDGSTITNASGDLTIVNTVDDGDIIFQSDDGSGGVETYFKLDGGDSSSNPLTLFPDNARAGFGASADLIIYHDGSNSYIQEQGTGDLIISGDNDVTIKDGTGNLLFNGNASNSVELYFGGSKKFETTSTGVTVTGVAVTDGLDLGDDEKIRLGDGQDLEIFHTSGNNFISAPVGGNLILQANNVTARSVAQENMITAVANGAVELYHDNSKKFETTSNGISVTDSTITLGEAGTTGLLQIKQASGTNTSGGSLQLYGGRSTGNASGGDIQFFVTAAGSSGSSVNSPTSVLHLEASDSSATFAGNISLADSKEIQLGAGLDLRIKHDGTNSQINSGTGDLFIQNTADDKDIIFKSDDGSGGTAEYFRLDGSATNVVFSKDLFLNDSVNIGMGNGGDYAQFHDGSNTYLSNGTGDFIIRNQADDKDIIFQADNGSGGNTEYFRLDGGVTRNIFLQDTNIIDNKTLFFGTGLDFGIIHDGTDTILTNDSVAGSDLIIRQATNDADLIFQCDNGSGGTQTYFSLDGSAEQVVFEKSAKFTDSDKILVGTGEDLEIFHDGSNSKIVANGTGSLIITQGTTDEDIIFKCDDGSGSETEYFRLDGSATSIAVSKNLLLGDNVVAKFGTGNDLLIYHDASNSNIQDTGTGNLQIGGTQVDILNSGLSEYKARFLSDGAVELYHNNSKKFETTSTGATVTGNLAVGDGSASSPSITFSGDTDTGIFRTASNAINFGTNGAERMRLTNTGLAIGSSSADGKLDITQSSATEPVIRLTDDGVCNYDFIFPDSDTIKLETSTSSNKTFKLLNAGSGNMNLEVSGSLSKGSGSFRIDHPVKPDTHYLYHSFVESPLTDLIYRGKTKLTKGKASINIDKHFGMTEGTFSTLVDDKQVFTTNEDTWDAVKGNLEGSDLNIECQNEDFDGYVSWLVIGDRKDKHIMEVDWTDDKGKPILEIQK